MSIAGASIGQRTLADGGTGASRMIRGRAPDARTLVAKPATALIAEPR